MRFYDDLISLGIIILKVSYDLPVIIVFKIIAKIQINTVTTYCDQQNTNCYCMIFSRKF